MSIETTIIASVIHERRRMVQGGVGGDDESVVISRYGRKMLRLAESGRIRRTDSNEDIAATLSSGLVMWLFWQVAPELLLWIVEAIRRRIWSDAA